MEEALVAFEKRLFGWIHKSSYFSQKIKQAACYALQEGKRFRPKLLFSLADTFQIPFSKVMDAACSLEMLHTYSLIHDDLPCMDDDRYRRGRPTLHIAYGEALAVLTGDFLLTYAFEVLSSSKELSPSEKLSLIQALARFSGNQGMIAGQVIDLSSTGKKLTTKELIRLHYYKTGCLIQCCFVWIASLSSCSAKESAILAKLGKYLGLIYQITDDILDHTSTLQKLGKEVGSDKKNQKSTALSNWGMEKAQTYQKYLCQAIQKILPKLSRPTVSLEKVLQEISERN